MEISSHVLLKEHQNGEQKSDLSSRKNFDQFFDMSGKNLASGLAETVVSTTESKPSITFQSTTDFIAHTQQKTVSDRLPTSFINVIEQASSPREAVNGSNHSNLDISARPIANSPERLSELRTTRSVDTPFQQQGAIDVFIERSYSDSIAPSLDPKDEGLLPVNPSTLNGVNPVFTPMVEQSGSEADVKLTRVLPFGLLANGYISMVSLFDKGIDDLRQISGISQNANIATRQPVYELHSPVKSEQTQSTLKIQNDTALSMAQNPVKQRVSNTSLQTSQIQLTAQNSEFLRQYLLITHADSGNTIWFRDYSISEGEKNQLKKRIADTQFIGNANISRVFINGNLEWQQKGDKAND